MYAIIHKPSRQFLPNGPGRKGRGFTHVEPSDEIPRLFKTQTAARSALTWWLQGKVTVIACPSSYESFYDDDERWEIEVIESRKAEDMAVVPVKLQVLETNDVHD